MLEKGGFKVVWFLSHVMVQSPNILVHNSNLLLPLNQAVTNICLL